MLSSLALMLACSGKQTSPYPVYTGDDLELTYTPQASSFRVWAPSAEAVELRLYDDGDTAAVAQVHLMDKAESGTWTALLDGDQKGRFYTFRIKYDGQWKNETPGIWAKAVGVNGDRAAIISLDDTDPEGWENDRRPELKKFNDIVIYEVHHRDFSIAGNSGIQDKGKFLAMTEPGTKTESGEATGIDHLLDLGVTHVHLLPSYDYSSVDEKTPEANQYNWGYDPKNYNVPEGSYSTDAYAPETRIREFKQMVQALHSKGIRVIMDVVYNHTAANDDSNFNLLVPGYFYRYKADGSYSDASGCGNEIASEKEMARRFIIESVKYWVNEYHVDGFRFDLMGIHDILTMNQLRDELDKIDPTLFVYGEGWTCNASTLPDSLRALKKNAPNLNRIAVFSDDLRDALKGSFSDAAGRGFVTGAQDMEESVKFGVAGGGAHPQVDYTKVNYSTAPYANSPAQVINYVSCHDDMCLVDKLNASAPEDATADELKRFDKLAQTIVFTSQGVPFIYAGEEVFRNKKGVHNSYMSPDSINAIDWQWKTQNKDIFEYYKALIALRKAHPAFRISTNEEVQESLRFLDATPAGVVAYTLGEHANGDLWKEILVIYNGNRKATEVTIPPGNWQVVCRDARIKAGGMGMIKGGRVHVEPTSALIAWR